MVLLYRRKILVVDIWLNVTSGRSRVAEILKLYCKIIIVADIPRVADIRENLRLFFEKY